MNAPAASRSSATTIARDVAVIGAGTAGLAAYRAARKAGASVVLVEGGPHGTTCARVGCMPSKLLIAAADAAHKARDAGPFGLRTTVEVDRRAVMDRVRSERDRFVSFVTRGVDEIPAVDRLDGWAAFEDPNTLSVVRPEGEPARVTARSIVIATGSRPFVPAVFDAVRDRVALNDDVFSWKELPSSVAVFGAGVIGLELGQALHRLGVRVRVFGRGGSTVHLSDPRVRSVAQEIFQAEFPFLPDAVVTRVARTETGVEIGFQGDGGAPVQETFEVILVAAGRRPNVEPLNLAKAGLPASFEVSPTTLSIAGSHVFMAGDANDDVPLLHEASDEGSIAGANAASYPVLTAGFRRTELAIAFTDPGAAIVGESWRELDRRGPFVAGEVRFEDQGRSRVMRENRGALRVYADPQSRVLLGAELIAPRGEHLAHLLAWSHQQKLTIDQMLAMPFYHPVIEEGLRTALRDAQARLDRGDLAH